jgi:hypothetical protein
MRNKDDWLRTPDDVPQLKRECTQSSALLLKDK